MIHAYRVTLEVFESVDVEAAEFQALLETRRAQLEQRIALYGGDPLPGQNLLASLDGHTVRVLWRLVDVGPERTDLFSTIVEFTAQFTTIASWQVEHHVCGNGRHRLCGAWLTILESP